MKPMAVFDIECYSNYFLIAFMDIDTKRVKTFEIRNGDKKFEDISVKKILGKYTVIGFNCIKYDHLILSAMFEGGIDLKQASNNIINNRMMPWAFEEKHNLKLCKVDMIDLIEVAPGIASLKVYGARMHSKTLQDLPYEHDTVLDEAQMDVVREYCLNDLATTLDLFNYLKPQLDLRETMSKKYDLDLRSKSDAQIAEAVIKKLLHQDYGVYAKKRELALPYKFKYVAPDYLKGKLNGLVDEIEALDFVVGENDLLATPEALKNKNITIGDTVYRMGIGGLHSSEKKLTLDVDGVIEDRDVGSYYPSLIINNKYYPEHLGEPFLHVYRTIYHERIAAKKSGDKVTADVMKLMLNGSFGKLGSKWSIFYSPDMLVQVTLTGQLSLLLLISELEDAGISVISANTDGVVLSYNDFSPDHVVKAWEKLTRLETDITPYKAIHNRDVNSYINIKKSGGVKTKGAFALDGIAKNPHGDIAIIAAINYLDKGTPIETTIYDCKDIRKFLLARKVTDGAVKNGALLGKVVRWYYSTQENGHIEYAKNGNKVSESDGGKPLMTLPESFPDDVDYQRYILMANDILTDVGVVK